MKGERMNYEVEFIVKTKGTDRNGAPKDWMNTRVAYKLGKVVLQKWKRVPLIPYL